MKNYLVKIRGGVEVDSAGKKAGKGPLIAEEISHTLGTSQDQYLFQAVEEKSKAIGFMRGLGGVQTMNEKMPTLQAANGTSGNNKPCVVYGIDQQGGKGNANYGENVMPTLCSDSHGTPHAVAYGVTTKGNGDAFVSEERHTALTNGGGQAGQGYPCVLTAVGVDRYNQATTGNVMPTIKTPKGGDDIPCVVTFEPGIASRDGGHVYEGVSGTLRATPGDNQMTVAFTTEMTPKVDTKGKAFSLRERDYKDPQAIVLENHPNDSRVKIDDSGTLRATPGDNQMTVAYDIGEARLRNPQEYIEKSPTITARCGTGGNNVPAVVFENHAQDSRYKGPLKVAQPVTATYGMGGNNQPLVICMATQQGGAEIMEDKCPTCAYRANAYDELEQTEKGATLKACGGNYGGGSENLCVERKRKVIEMNNQEEYIVRRLTPLECCRLQGFPDGWAEIDYKEDFTEEEYQFWLEVRNTFAEINGKQVKDYTKEQMLKWYNKLHTDSAEYKMWGNGIGLPNALYVMQGIVRETGGQNEKGLHTL